MISNRNYLTNCDKMSMHCWSQCLLSSCYHSQATPDTGSTASLPFGQQIQLLYWNWVTFYLPEYFLSCPLDFPPAVSLPVPQYWWVNCLIMTSKMPFSKSYLLFKTIQWHLSRCLAKAARKYSQDLNEIF